MATPRSTWPLYPQSTDRDLVIFLESLRSAILGTCDVHDDILLTSIADGDYLRYDAASEAFLNVPITTVVGEADHGLLLGLADDDHTQYHNDTRALTWLGTRSTTDLAEGSNLYYTDARWQTAWGLKTTTNLPEGTNLYFTDERVDDRVAALIINSSSVQWTYVDASNTLSAAVLPGGVDHGGLAGLGDDDHTQYLLAAGTRQLSGAWDVGAQNITNLATLAWGGDTTLYRSAANTLKTDDNFIVAGGTLTVGANSITAAQLLDLIDGGETSLHKHDAMYYTESEVNALFTAAGFTGQTAGRLAYWTDADTLGSSELARTSSVLYTLTGTRNISFEFGAQGYVNIKAQTGGWATYYKFTGSSDTNLGGFGALGSSDSLTYYFIGTYSTDERMQLYSRTDIRFPGVSGSNGTLYLGVGTAFGDTYKISFGGGRAWVGYDGSTVEAWYGTTTSSAKHTAIYCDGARVFRARYDTAELELAGSLVLMTSPGYVYHDSNATYTIISGGDSVSQGANLLLYGGAHASYPNYFQIRHGTNPIISYDGSGGVLSLSSATSVNINGVAKLLIDGTDATISAGQTGLAENGGGLYIGTRASMYFRIDNDANNTGQGFFFGNNTSDYIMRVFEDGNNLVKLLLEQTGSYIVAGPSSGFSAIIGAPQHTDAAALNYRAYFAYDCYWDDVDDEWNAIRTNLGRKWMLDMGYHNNAFRVRTFDGTVSAPWADSAWTTVLEVNAAGEVTANSATNPYFILAESGTDRAYLYYNTTSNYLSLMASEAASYMLLGTAGTSRWKIDASGHLLPYVDSTYNIGSNTERPATIYCDVLDVTTFSPATITTTGFVQIGGSLIHKGTHVGFYNITEVTRATAYTQTYSTATKTHANPTATSMSWGSGTACHDAGTYNTNFLNAATQIGYLVADVANIKQVLNSVIDDLQRVGLVQ